MQGLLMVAIGGFIMLAAGCAEQPPPKPPRPAARVHPPDWFHQQLAAARAARRNHQPRTDTVGAQRAYDDTMRAACTRAALMGPDKYPARCDAVLHPTPAQSAPDADPLACEDDTDPAQQTACSD
ncbi:hypothetical protein [Rhodopila sp.]|uniref:hypothetical protein n=1 Tax=Rhodopila sp. TaxID=2480087 RepID=UPI003D136357